MGFVHQGSGQVANGRPRTRSSREERYLETLHRGAKEALARIDEAAETILVQVCIDFRDDPWVLALWRSAEAKLNGDIVRFLSPQEWWCRISATDRLARMLVRSL